MKSWSCLWYLRNKVLEMVFGLCALMCCYTPTNVLYLQTIFCCTISKIEKKVIRMCNQDLIIAV